MTNVGPRILVQDGVTYVYDNTRGKMLSVDHLILRAGRKWPNVTNQALRVEDGQPMITVGDTIKLPATIVGLNANCESNATWTLQVLERSSPTVLASLTLVGESKKYDNTINVDVSAGAVLILKVNGVNVPYPRAMVELAWRL